MFGFGRLGLQSSAPDQREESAARQLYVARLGRGEDHMIWETDELQL